MASYINPANAITAARFLTLPPFVYFCEHDMLQWAGMMVLACAFGDVIDGKVAKLLGCTSRFGEIFDAIADAVCYGFIMVMLLAWGWVPWIPVAVMLALGVVNTVMRGAYARRAGEATNYTSYAMERVVAFFAFLCGFGIVQYEVEYFFYLCAAIMTIVVIHDTKRMLVDPIERDEAVAT